MINSIEVIISIFLLLFVSLSIKTIKVLFSKFSEYRLLRQIQKESRLAHKTFKQNKKRELRKMRIPALGKKENNKSNIENTKRQFTQKQIIEENQNKIIERTEIKQEIITPVKPKIQYDTKRDMEFLNLMVTEKCKTALAVDLSDFFDDETKILNDSEYNEIVANTAYNVYKMFSEDYLERLSEYISKDHIASYIYEKVVIELSPYLVEIHKRRI